MQQWILSLKSFQCQLIYKNDGFEIHSRTSKYIEINPECATLPESPGLCMGSAGMQYREPPHHAGTLDFSIPAQARQRAGCARAWLKRPTRILAALSTVVLAKLSPVEIWPWTAVVEPLLSISSPKRCFIPQWEPIFVVLEQSELSLSQHFQSRKCPEIA